MCPLATGAKIQSLAWIGLSFVLVLQRFQHRAMHSWLPHQLFWLIPRNAAADKYHDEQNRSCGESWDSVRQQRDDSLAYSPIEKGRVLFLPLCRFWPICVSLGIDPFWVPFCRGIQARSFATGQQFLSQTRRGAKFSRSSHLLSQFLFVFSTVCEEFSALLQWLHTLLGSEVQHFARQLKVKLAVTNN